MQVEVNVESVLGSQMTQTSVISCPACSRDILLMHTAQAVYYNVLYVLDEDRQIYLNGHNLYYNLTTFLKSTLLD